MCTHWRYFYTCSFYYHLIKGYVGWKFQLLLTTNGSVTHPMNSKPYTHTHTHTHTMQHAHVHVVMWTYPIAPDSLWLLVHHIIPLMTVLPPQYTQRCTCTYCTQMLPLFRVAWTFQQFLFLLKNLSVRLKQWHHHNSAHGTDMSMLLLI